MAWKGVHLTRPARLSLDCTQLRVEQEDGETRFPLEDIAWIVADNHKTTLSVALLAACADHRTAAVARLQLDAGAPLKKRLWQAIVRAKIVNQSEALKRAKVLGYPPLSEMAGRVRSGDPDNIEARAARDYWQALFDNFTRGAETDLRNNALNYAYAVLRGCVTRSLTAAGLLPAIGLHHDSATNSFNLTDDLIEPFRPFADLAVHSHLEHRDPAEKLTKNDRQVFAALPLCDADIASETMSVLHTSEAVAQSLVRSFENNRASELIPPTFPALQPALPSLTAERT